MRKSEIYKGRKIATKVDRKRGQVATFINGTLLGYAYGTSEAIQDREMVVLRSWIDEADRRAKTDPTAYPAHFYKMVG